MSTELFRVRLARTQVHPDDLKWMPKWLDEYARYQGVNEETIAVEQDGVLREESAGSAGCASGGVVTV